MLPNVFWQQKFSSKEKTFFKNPADVGYCSPRSSYSSFSPLRSKSLKLVETFLTCDNLTWKQLAYRIQSMRAFIAPDRTHTCPSA
jgi:hypothetical protein